MAHLGGHLEQHCVPTSEHDKSMKEIHSFGRPLFFRVQSVTRSNVTLDTSSTSPSLVDAVRGSAALPGELTTCRFEEVPDQRLPRGATHSCSAPPTAATRSKSAS